MGREISKVMGHLGAGWLERPERIQQERTDLLIENLSLRPTDKVVDLGAGSEIASPFGSPLLFRKEKSMQSTFLPKCLPSSERK